MTEALRALEWVTPLPSETNFVLCRIGGGRDAKAVKQAHREAGRAGALLRQGRPARLPAHSVGKPEHTDALVSALNTIG